MGNIFFPDPKADSGGDWTAPVDEGEKTACALAALVHLLNADLEAKIGKHIRTITAHMESATSSWDSAVAEIKNLAGAIEDIENKNKQAGESLLRDTFPPGDQLESHRLSNIKNAVEFLLKPLNNTPAPRRV